MPRSTIAAVLALLMILAPAASARTVVQPERVTDTGGLPKVMPERITDHRADAPTSSLAGTTDATAAAYAQEQYYGTYNTDRAALTREQESVSGSGNQGVARADDDAPWLILALGIGGAMLAAGGLTVMARRTRTRARVTA
jgi:hypothetical protein